MVKDNFCKISKKLATFSRIFKIKITKKFGGFVAFFFF
jgi:hypothetical protein